MFRRYQTIGTAVCCSLLSIPVAELRSQTAAATPQPVKVSNVRQVFDNGEHNAFTDLIRFKGTYFLTFRSCPDGHMVHPTSSIIILSSEDTRTWREIHRFRIPRRDTRDPHFLAFNGKLFVYTGTWYSGDTTLAIDQYDINRHLGYAVSSTNGYDWTEPVMLEGTYGHYVWRANTFGEKAYLCGRRKRNFEIGPRSDRTNLQSAMLESDDGLVWKTRALFQETYGDETAFQFEDDGRIVAVGRRGSQPAQMLKSAPPYDRWQRTDLDQYIGGPLLARWGKRYVVGGRQNTKDGPQTALYWLENDELQQFAILPSGGDNSYPGFVTLDDRHAIVSWYSSHETSVRREPITAIYLAELTIHP